MKSKPQNINDSLRGAWLLFQYRASQRSIPQMRTHASSGNWGLLRRDRLQMRKVPAFRGRLARFDRLAGELPTARFCEPHDFNDLLGSSCETGSNSTILPGDYRRTDGFGTISRFRRKSRGISKSTTVSPGSIRHHRIQPSADTASSLSVGRNSEGETAVSGECGQQYRPAGATRRGAA